MIKFRSKFQFQILLQFYRTAEKVTKMKLVIIMVKSFDKYHHLFFLLTLSGVGLFIRRLSYGSQFSRTWNHCQVKVRSRYLVWLLSQCWITGGHTIHPPVEGLLPLTGIEPTPFQNSASKVAGLQVHYILVNNLVSPDKPNHQAAYCPTANFGLLSRGSVTNLMFITEYDPKVTGSCASGPEIRKSQGQNTLHD